MPESYLTGMAGRFRPSIGITKADLDKRGLWDMDRYTSPYVHDGILQRMFGGKWGNIKETFFEPTWGDRLKFKPEQFSSEKKIAAFLEKKSKENPASEADNEFVKSQLFLLFNNVILLKDEETPDLYHPRFNCEKTTSFQELSDDWKRIFRELHNDYFFVRHDELWKQKGLERLPIMKDATNMLVCGEDLGLIPNCVPFVMEETSIIGLRVQRMPPDAGVEFDDPAKYPYACVATLSSHDTSTFRGWWEEITDSQRESYWRNILKKDGSPPKSCATSIVEQAVDQHLASSALWAIFPIQDLLGFDEKLRRPNAAEEQINDPSNSMHYWRFRMHINVEDILASHEFVQKCKQLNEKNYRGVSY
mmetsp:Transcript_26530/g.66501  ORF Transcript_26530/g.66501 Transcript_26530/m.66501 type:complete len:362 (+) Transcript_26530:146-1231(+)